MSFFTDPTWMPDGRSIVALGPSIPESRGLPQRPLAVLSGRLRREPGRGSKPLGRARPDARLRHEQRCHDRRRDPRHPVAGRRLADVHRADPGGLRAVPDRGGRWPSRADHGRPALHLGLGRHRGGGDRGPAPDRLPALDADRGAGPLLDGRSLASASPDRVQQGRPRRHRAPTGAGAPCHGRWLGCPGLVHPGRRRHGRASARPRDPRRSAHALRLVADVGVPGPRGRRDRRLLQQPARLRGLRRGLQRRQLPRLGPGADAGRPGRRGVARRRTASRTPIASA